jgi:hypothetical protein
VTYKWLSTTLDVPINVSKQFVGDLLVMARATNSNKILRSRMLFHFTKQNSSAAIVYFVSGWDVAQQRHVVTLVPKDKLDGMCLVWSPII